MESSLLHKSRIKLLEDAGELAKKTKREDVISWAYLSFKLIYDELTRTKDIKPIAELDKQTKMKYWKETEGIETNFSHLETGRLGFSPAPTKTKRIWICQALYIFDLITNP